MRSELSPRAEKIAAWAGRTFARLILAAVAMVWGFHLGHSVGFRDGVDASIGELGKAVDRAVAKAAEGRSHAAKP